MGLDMTNYVLGASDSGIQTSLLWRYVLIQIWSFCAGRKTSCGGIFAYVCTEKLASVDYSAKHSFVQDWSLCVDTQKATSYLDHFCARKVGVLASIRNLDLKITFTKVFHAGLFVHLEI